MSSIIETYKRDIAFKGDLVRTATGDLDTLSGIANVTEAIFHRLITVKGTLVHRPEYGVGIKNFQNALNTLSKQRELANIIGEQLILDPRVVEVRSVSITAKDNTPQNIELSIKVKLAGYGDQTLSFLPFNEET